MLSLHVGRAPERGLVLRKRDGAAARDEKLDVASRKVIDRVRNAFDPGKKTTVSNGGAPRFGRNRKTRIRSSPYAAVTEMSSRRQSS